MSYIWLRKKKNRNVTNRYYFGFGYGCIHIKWIWIWDLRFGLLGSMHLHTSTVPSFILQDIHWHKNYLCFHSFDRFFVVVQFSKDQMVIHSHPFITTDHFHFGIDFFYLNVQSYLIAIVKFCPSVPNILLFFSFILPLILSSIQFGRIQTIVVWWIVVAGRKKFKFIRYFHMHYELPWFDAAILDFRVHYIETPFNYLYPNNRIVQIQGNIFIRNHKFYCKVSLQV